MTESNNQEPKKSSKFPRIPKMPKLPKLPKIPSLGKSSSQSQASTSELKDSEETKKIPLSHVIHVDIDDEVSTIFDRLKAKNAELVYLVVPYRAVLFQSIVNVKILKRKAKDIEKEIAFITKDKSGVFFANKCNIQVFDQVGENKKPISADNIPENILTEADREKSEYTNARPTKSDTPKTSIAELVARINYVTIKEKVQKFLFKLSRQKGRQQYTQRLLMSNPNRTLLLSLTIGSLLLLSLIAYIALPNATIYVKANSVPIEQPVNITFADAEKNAGLLRTRPNRVIASYPVNPGVLETVIDYEATGNDLTGENARGMITVYNKVNREFALVPFTRFQTESGIIFRTQNYVVIPAGTPENASQIQVEIVADPVDINNVPVGDRGNLEANTRFVLPGLKTVSSDQVYALNLEPFTGGVTSKERIVTTRDIEAAREFARTELIKEVPKKMQEYISKYNAEKNLSLALLNDPQTIKIGEVQVILDDSIVGQKMNTFKVTARVESSGIAYDHKEFIEILKNEIALRKSPDKTLIRVDENGATSRILSINEAVGLIELTATIQGVEQFTLNQSNEAGQRIIKKITDHIAGLEVREAKQYIESLPEIETADITTWPFWAPTIPSRTESIKILIDDRKN